MIVLADLCPADKAGTGSSYDACEPLTGSLDWFTARAMAPNHGRTRSRGSASNGGCDVVADLGVSGVRKRVRVRVPSEAAAGKCASTESGNRKVSGCS